MHLKSLEIQGYKSFANKIEFKFDDGITAVVGPNGSGKSNVADAIRWVLGEQSYSNLRGKKTEDMIFSGSDGRARLGMATATLVLDNADKWLPLDFSEVTLTRRAYRSGENEYYLNGSRVRLRDINELLAKSGLGRQTYTVIGQGTIDRVLSLHADERRKLFEEAAGITFHHQKRAQTLARLDETRANLLRLNDIVKEIEPRLNRLEKQAERTEEVTRLISDLEDLLRLWYGYRWRQCQIQLGEAKTRLRDSETSVEKQRRELHELDAQLAKLRSEQAELRSQVGSWYADNNQLHSQAETIQRELAVNEERGHQYAAQREEMLEELRPLEANHTGQQQQVTETEAALEAINQELSRAEAARQAVQQKLEAYQAQRQTILTRQHEAETQARRLEAALTERQARLGQFAERRETLLVERRHYEAEVARLSDQQGQLQEKQQQLLAELASIDGELVALESAQIRLRDQATELNQAAEQLKARMTTAERKSDALKARQDLLGKLRGEMAGYYSGVRAVLHDQTDLSGIVGPVSQVIQVRPDLEVALEAALGSRVQDVVVNSFADAEAAIAYLKAGGRGRATFLPLDTIRPGKGITVPDLPGVIGLASELVQCMPELRPIAELTLNRTVVVNDLPAARRVFGAMQGGFQIVTREGELMRSGGAVSGGRARGDSQESTFLAREREWRELPGQLETLDKTHQSLSGQLADNHEQAVTLNKELHSLAEQQQQQNARRQEVQAVADKAGQSLSQLEISIGWQRELEEKATAELERLDQRQAETQEEMARLEQEKVAAEEAARQLTAEADTLSSETLLAELNVATAALTTVQQQQKSRQAILENQQATLRQLASQIESKQVRAETLLAERQTLLEQQQSFQDRRAEFARQLDQFSTQIGDTERRLAELGTQQSKVEETEASLRQRLQWLEGEHNRASLEAARRQDEIDNLQRQIQDDLGLVNLDMSDDQIGQPVLPIRPLVSDLPLVEELPVGVEEDVKRLKVQVRRLGNINPEAPREYAELRERHNFLTGQMDDLEAAAADLKEIMARLDMAMQEAFTETFERVASEFERYFKALFGGGEAQLIQTNPDNLIETGVDIVVRPPGKRLQSLALLSGGERSLTAQALIFALLRTGPTPFVIFDEVDAMLDEANVGRFRDALAALASDIQFIIITHNRKTIEAANTIYGVSMSDDSVSQVYSLKIEDWLEKAR